jgi:CMP-N-acetylneuraminic acid synthetase
MKINAIMPIKLTNERLPGKNTKMLGGKPLLQYALESLLAVTAIDGIDVFCSDDRVCEFLPKGVRFVNRSKELDSPTSNFTQIFKEYSNRVESDIYVYAHATAPFISIDTIEECIDAVQRKGYDSAFCAMKIQDFLWQDGKPLNFDPKNLPRSQDLNVIHRETSGIYVFTKKTFMKHRSRIGHNPYIKEVSFLEAVDINDPWDFTLAEMLLPLYLSK